MTKSYFSKKREQVMADGGIDPELVNAAVDEIDNSEKLILLALPVDLASTLIMEIQIAKKLAPDSSFNEKRSQLYASLYQFQFQLPLKTQALLNLGWEKIGVKFVDS